MKAPGTSIVRANFYTSLPLLKQHLIFLHAGEKILKMRGLILQAVKERRDILVKYESNLKAAILIAIRHLIKRQSILDIPALAKAIAEEMGEEPETVRGRARSEIAEIMGSLVQVLSYFNPPPRPKNEGKELEPEVKRKVNAELRKLHPDTAAVPPTKEEKEFLNELLDAKRRGDSTEAQGLLFLRGHKTDLETLQDYMSILYDRLTGRVTEIRQLKTDVMKHEILGRASLEEERRKLPPLNPENLQLFFNAVGDEKLYERTIFIMLKSAVRFLSNPFSLLNSERPE